MNPPGQFTARISLLHMTPLLRRTVQKWIDRAQAGGWHTKAETTMHHTAFGEFQITFTPPSHQLAEKGEPRKVN